MIFFRVVEISFLFIFDVYVVPTIFPHCEHCLFLIIYFYNLFCFVYSFCFSHILRLFFEMSLFPNLVMKCHFCFDNKKENKKQNFLKKRKRKKKVFKTQILIQSVVKNVIQNSTDIPNFELLPRTDYFKNLCFQYHPPNFFCLSIFQFFLVLEISTSIEKF